MADSIQYATNLTRYKASWLGGSIDVELHDDVVISRGKSNGVRFETNISLANLQPHVDRLWVRTAAFRQGLWLAGLGFGGCYFCVRMLQKPVFSEMPGMLLVLGICGVILSLATLRSTEFARFVNLQGSPALDIARAGRREALEAFVAKILTRVQEIHAASAHDSSDGR